MNGTIKEKGPAETGPREKKLDGEGSFMFGQSNYSAYSPDLSSILRLHQDLSFFYLDQARPGAGDGSFLRWFELFLQQLDICNALMGQTRNG